MTTSRVEWPGPVGNAAGHMACGHMLGGVLDVSRLVVKEKVGLELAQKLALGQATQKHGLVHLDVPVHEGANGTFVRRCTARRDQRRPNAHVAGARVLELVQRLEQGLERAARQRQRRLVLT